ncbi:MAG: hypothetical protein RLZZ175_2305 [Bacteroidota bacterium]|jgi:hypothetical protein
MNIKDLDIIDKNFLIVEKSDFFNNYTEKTQGYKIFEGDTTLYFSNIEKGVLFIFSECNILDSIIIFGKGHQKYKPFKDNLPFNINLNDNMQEVMRKFGAFEIRKGGGDILPILGIANYWNMYLIEGHCFRFEFKNNVIISITLSNKFKEAE